MIRVAEPTNQHRHGRSVVLFHGPPESGLRNQACGISNVFIQIIPRRKTGCAALARSS